MLFLEQNRNVAPGKIKGVPNQIALREGIAAAHSENSAADVLFRSGVLKESSQLAKVFKGLYENAPAEYFIFPELLRCQ